MTIGERVKKRREELGLTQQELSNKMGYSNKSAISRIETCGNKISIKRVSSLADALNCTTAYLMGWEDIVFDDVSDNSKKYNDYLIKLKDNNGNEELLEMEVKIHEIMSDEMYRSKLQNEINFLYENLKRNKGEN